MALPRCFHACKSSSFHKRRMTQSPGNRRESFEEATSRPAAEQFAPLAAARFRRRILVGLGSATLVAVGANFGGVTSFLLGLCPETSQNLKLDVVYPVEGYNRCIDTNEGFEFIYPASWVGDQRLLYRAAEKTEFERSLDPPPLNNAKPGGGSRKNVDEPVVAFGPPGTTGGLNVSVIVSPVPPDFKQAQLRIEAFGGPKEVGEAIVRAITGSGKRPEVEGTLVESTLREDPMRNANYHELGFRVESPSFCRHNVAGCCARMGDYSL